MTDKQAYLALWVHITAEILVSSHADDDDMEALWMTAEDKLTEITGTPIPLGDGIQLRIIAQETDVPPDDNPWWYSDLTPDDDKEPTP